MEVKKRIFYLDFIRAFATLIIILCHFNALFIYNVYRPYMAIGSTEVFRIYIGSFGVSLFLILSGASLMLVYKNKTMNLKEFYKKRFKKIFPMFWLAYILVLSITALKYGDLYINRSGIPKLNYIYSFLGIDGYLSCFNVKTFYMIGEWFLGFILIFYAIFPLLLFLVKKYPKITAICGLIVYFVSIYIFKDYPTSAVIFPIRIVELLFGMYFIKYDFKVKIKHVIPCVVFLLVVSIFNIPINMNILVTLVGITSFMCLVFIGNYAERFNIIKNVSIFISTLSYPCFILHHWIIFQMIEHFDLNAMNKSTAYILFVCTLIVVFVASYVLQKIYDIIRDKIFMKDNN